jgi:hypothetical protein
MKKFNITKKRIKSMIINLFLAVGIVIMLNMLSYGDMKTFNIMVLMTLYYINLDSTLKTKREPINKITSILLQMTNFLLEIIKTHKVMLTESENEKLIEFQDVIEDMTTESK